MHCKVLKDTLSFLHLLMFILNAGDSDAATTTCQQRFYRDKSENDGFSCGCFSVLGVSNTTLAQCIDYACQYNGNAINFIAGHACYIKQCVDMDDLKYTSSYGGWDIYVLPKKCESAGPLNSDRSTGNMIGYYQDQLAVTCNSGYVIEGVGGDLTSYQTSCRDSGLWSVVKNCEAIVCNGRGFENTTMKHDAIAQYSENITFDCSAGYWTEEGHLQSGIAVCGYDGKWIINKCISKSAYFEKVLDDYFVDKMYLDRLDQKELDVTNVPPVQRTIRNHFACADACLRVTGCHWFHYKAEQCRVPSPST